MRHAVVLVCLAAVFVAKADATPPIQHCTSIASVNGHPVGGIVVAAHVPRNRLTALCANITPNTPGRWTNHPGTALPAGWKIGDVYRNTTSGLLVQIAAPPGLLSSVNASLAPTFSSQSGWQRVG
jgi:hypothetical protein